MYRGKRFVRGNLAHITAGSASASGYNTKYNCAAPGSTGASFESNDFFYVSVKLSVFFWVFFYVDKTLRYPKNLATLKRVATPQFPEHWSNAHIVFATGAFDALLRWPFDYRITFFLLDQNNDPNERKHVKFSIKPNPCPENEPFLGRPKMEKNASFGGAKFVRHDEIESRKYIKDDTIFIKVVVDCDGVSEPWGLLWEKTNFKLFAFIPLFVEAMQFV